MCGRFALTTPIEAVASWFDGQAPDKSNFKPNLKPNLVLLPEALDLNLHVNTAPTHRIPILTRNPDNCSLQLQAMHWGFVSRARPAPLINARSETALAKPTWRACLAQRRCVFILSGYFEWHRQGRQRSPYYFYHEDRPMLVAGCWRPGLPDTGPQAALLTQAASPELARIHDRMPLFISRAQARLWLEPQAPEKVAILRDAFVESGPPAPIKNHRADPRLGRVQEQSLELLKPYEPPAGPDQSGEEKTAQLSLLL